MFCTKGDLCPMKINLSPQDAWRKYILPVGSAADWIENSNSVGEGIDLKPRELLGLILLAYLEGVGGDKWNVCWDSEMAENNDGYVQSDEKTIIAEHKVIPNLPSQVIPEVMQQVIDTYNKNNEKGPEYGKNRTLIIQPNITTRGLVKVSALTDEIDTKSNFDRVLLVYLVKKVSDLLVFHVLEHYPVKNALSTVTINKHDGTLHSLRIARELLS